MVLYVTFGISYMGILIGFDTCLAFLIGYSAPLIFMIILMRVKLGITLGLVKARDKRISLLTNVLQNINYVKLRAWELFYHIRVFRLREKEIKAIFKETILNGFLIFGWWLARGTCAAAVLFYYTFLYSGVITVEQISAFIRIMDLLSMALGELPWTLSYFVDLKISLERIGKFLESPNLDREWMQVYTQEV